MRLVRFLVRVVFLAILGRLAVRTVRVESTGEQVRITIDKRKLAETGREAAGKVGAALENAGRKLDGQSETRE
jgi:hypothetical protein